MSTSRGRASSAPPSPSLAESPHMPCLKEVKEGRGERGRGRGKEGGGGRGREDMEGEKKPGCPPTK